MLINDSLHASPDSYGPSRPASAIKLVCLHSTESPEVTHGARNIVTNVFSRSEAASHYVVDNAEVYQCIDDLEIAYATGAKDKGVVNKIALQVELIGYANQTAAQWADAYSTAERNLAIELVASLCSKYGIPPVYVDADGLKAGKSGITMHRDATTAFKQSNHTDPGPNFPITSFVAAVAKRMGQATPPVPTSGGTGKNPAEMVVAEARMRLGMNENDGTATAYTGRDTKNVAWCQIFANTVFKRCGITLPNGNSDSTRYSQETMAKEGLASTPVLGGLAYRTRGARTEYKGHVGIIVGISGDQVTTIEGNSGSASDRVAQHTKASSEWDLGFIDPYRTAGSTMPSSASVFDLVAFGIRMVESRGDYTLAPKSPGAASGAYQYLGYVWANYGGFADAYKAPPATQDARFAEDMKPRLAKYPLDAAIGGHMWPSLVDKLAAGDAEAWARKDGNGISTRTYVDRVKEWMSKAPASVTTTTPTGYVEKGIDLVKVAPIAMERAVLDPKRSLAGFPWTDVAVNYQIDFSTTSTSELKLTMADPGLVRLGSKLLRKGASMIEWNGVPFQLAAIDLKGDESGQQVVLTFRDLVTQQLRLDYDTTPVTGTPGQVLATKVGYVIAQAAPNRGGLCPDLPAPYAIVPPSWYDVIHRCAGEDGFWFWCSHGTAHYGQPTWLAGKIGLAYPLPNLSKGPTGDVWGIPEAHVTIDDPSAEQTIQLAMAPGAAIQLRLGTLLPVQGLGPMDGYYMTTRISGSNDPSKAWEVTGVVPKDPPTQTMTGSDLTRVMAQYGRQA